MKDLQITSDPAVEQVFDQYPVHVRPKMEGLRILVRETAREMEGVGQLEETLRWGEPSFITKKGSTLRMDWKAKQPDRYALYFKCTSKLVPSFRMAYQDIFTFEGTRAIVFQLDDKVPKEELKQCIRAALAYHKVKHLPLLGLGL
ncbi:DUF1801 domain-containing protein [Echinicola strongylocentroti]|uniref:DUF1801 domain-containing protein n=1 Tax=Echinicola strongylocentroti TaxID=1795355 RepID=A0A2Z4IKN3_9BACT|nr:DUF1801 domain-containing protein [Echinicola strongylocentroti]AWW31098.1 DUF1801 domain-containing protein [Echinicola strongylocentroti]